MSENAKISWLTQGENIISPKALVEGIQNTSGTSLTTLLSNVSSFVNVADYGAKGDGTTDDTSAIQSAIDYAVENKATVAFNAGTYIISDRLIIPSSCTLMGAGQNLTTINFTLTEKHETSDYDTDWWTESDSAIVIKADDVVLKDFTLLGNVSQYNGVSMHFIKENETSVYRGSERSQMSNVTIKGFRNGLFLYAGWERYIHNCYFRDNSADGICYKPLEASVTGNWSGSGDTILACSFVNNADAGFYGEYEYNTILYDCVFEYNGHAINVTECKNLTLFNCWNEANYDNLIVNGSIKFVGGYNISKDTITHDGVGYVFVEKPGDEIIFSGSDTIYRMQEGVIIKGVNIGTELDNKLKNVGFYSETHGSGKEATFDGWDIYDEYRWSIDTDTIIGDNYSAKCVVENQTVEQWFSIGQKVTGFEEGDVVRLSCSILTPDRSAIDAGAFIQVVPYTSSDEVILRDTKTITPIADNTWESYLLSSTLPSGTAYIKVFFGLVENGTIYFSSPCCTDNEDINLNKLYAELNDGVIEFKDINGSVKGTNLELGETSTTAYAGDKGKETRDLVDNALFLDDTTETVTTEPTTNFVEWSQLQTDGKNIADITIDGTTTSVYAPNKASDIYYDTDNTVEQKISDLNDTLSEKADKSWNLLGSTTSSATVTLPSDYNELIMYAVISSATQGQYCVQTTYIEPILSGFSSNRYLTFGNGFTASSSGKAIGVNVQYLVSTKQLSLVGCYVGTTSCLSETTVFVYYR